MTSWRRWTNAVAQGETRGVSTTEALAAVHSERREAESRYGVSSLTRATLSDDDERRLTAVSFATTEPKTKNSRR